jgi:hypothetical protein
MVLPRQAFEGTRPAGVPGATEHSTDILQRHTLAATWWPTPRRQEPR